jgi:lysyl-tRNA synthetase class I
MKCEINHYAECAKRWQQSLDPELDHSEWREEEVRILRQKSSKGNSLTAEQDRILIEATQQLGRHWKDIQREHFPGRSKNTIKNRYVFDKSYE